MGLNYCEMVGLLCTQHDCMISERHLKRLLRLFGLRRRKNYTDDQVLIEFISRQIMTSGQLHGYRWMWMKCLHEGFVVKKEHVRELMKVLDPAGVAARCRRSLRRRQYHADGPNFIWHVDGYDKLKPYGFCISGCIDGFSRKIIWLKVHTTNSDPKVIAGYYVEAVASLGFAPKVVRTDMGTENHHICDMQIFLRRNGQDSHARSGSTFMYGTSQHNQRIESWWSILRKENCDFWIQFFLDLKSNGYFTGDYLDKNLVQFCFTRIIKVRLISIILSDTKYWGGWSVSKAGVDVGKIRIGGGWDCTIFLHGTLFIILYIYCIVLCCYSHANTCTLGTCHSCITVVPSSYDL